ncbi:MAG: hypothetical protein CMH62_01815 [Nanoarchaeota archaeon]|nr:hypothetical protein [Nanoarchaeota archaeon]
MSVFLVFLALGIVGVQGISPDYQISRVEVNDKQVNTGDTNFIVVDRGETLEVDVWVDGKGTGSVNNDVRVRTWIGGYEFGDITERSELFKVEPDGTYHRTLFVEVPDDIDADSNGLSESYTLHVEVFDRNNEDRQDFTFKIDEKRHDLRIQDVVFRPGLSVDAGEILFSTIRVENMGDKKEEDIQVRVSIPELGVLARDYIDELVPEDNNIEDEESSDDVDLFFRVPRSAEAKDYNVKVELIYNRGHETLSENFIINVDGERAGSAGAETVISLDAVSKNVAQTSTVAYKVMVANFGSDRAVYSAEVLGVGVWGTSSVEPGFVSVNAGETGELLVKVTPNANVEGTQSFTVKVQADGETLKEVNLNANVESVSDLGNVKRGLEIGFAILAILLVILGLIIAFNKLKGDDEDEESLGGEETSAGQTYY